MKTNIAVYPKIFFERCNLLQRLNYSTEIIPINSWDDLNMISVNVDVLITPSCNFLECKCLSNGLILYPITNKQKKIIVQNTTKHLNCNKIYKDINCLSNAINSINRKYTICTILNIDLNKFSINIIKLIELFDENCFISIKESAQKIGYSRNHFSLLIKKELGINFVSFRRLFRVAKVIILLKEKHSLKEISDQLTYSSVSHIYRDFYNTMDIKSYKLMEYLKNNQFDKISIKLKNYALS